jgi:hypothetical protein
MKRSVLGLLVFLCAFAAVPAASAGGDDNPSAICRSGAIPELNEFVGTGGGCVSTVASVGIEALMAGAFPSTAAAVENCKFLEENVFGGYPYSFYGNPDYTAKNRAECVYFIRAFHTGLLPPGPGE